MLNYFKLVCALNLTKMALGTTDINDTESNSKKLNNNGLQDKISTEELNSNGLYECIS